MNKEKELIRELYNDFKEIINMNENLYIVPTEFYNQLVKKLSHLDDKLKRQTESLKRNQKTITEQRREIKKLNEMDKRKSTGIKDIKGKMIYEGDIILRDSKVYWNKERGMWGISGGKYPLGDYKSGDDFKKIHKKKLKEVKNA